MPNDNSCLRNCIRNETECRKGMFGLEKLEYNKCIFEDCPCNTNCPNGCIDCLNPICLCGGNPSQQNKENLETCKKDKSIDLGQCIIDCKNDQGCENKCVEHFKLDYETCPCQVSRF